MLGPLIALVVVGIVVAFIWSVILRASVTVFNKLTSGSPVEEPSKGKALMIAIATVIAQNVASFFLGMMMGGGREQSMQDRLTLVAMTLPVSFIVTSIMLTIMLPTDFPRALAIAAIIVVIAILIGVLLGGFFWLLASSTAGPR